MSGGCDLVALVRLSDGLVVGCYADVAIRARVPVLATAANWQELRRVALGFGARVGQGYRVLQSRDLFAHHFVSED